MTDRMTEDALTARLEAVAADLNTMDYVLLNGQRINMVGTIHEAIARVTALEAEKRVWRAMTRKELEHAIEAWKKDEAIWKDTEAELRKELEDAKARFDDIAAMVAGDTTGDYIISYAQASSDRIALALGVPTIRLSPRDQETFAKALLDAPLPDPPVQEPRE